MSQCMVFLVVVIILHCGAASVHGTPSTWTEWTAVLLKSNEKDITQLFQEGPAAFFFPMEPEQVETHRDIEAEHSDVIKRDPIVYSTEKNWDNCDNVGVEIFREEERNLCSGMYCHPWQAVCKDGSILQFWPHLNNTVPDYDGIIATDCYITRIRCKRFDVDWYTVYDLEETFNATNCSVETIQGATVKPEQIPNVILVGDPRVHSQVLCSNFKRYGYSFWDYYCEDQELICNGTVVDVDFPLPQEVGDNLKEDCQVITKACNEYLFHNTCHKMEILCNGDPLENCTYQREPISCLNATAPLDCFVTKANCDGVSVNVSNFHGDVSLCRIEEVTCGESVIPYENSNCTVDQMKCPTKSETNSFSRCIVQRLHCNSVEGDSDECTILEPVCIGAPDCGLSLQTAPCVPHGSCIGKSNTSSCVCPVDRVFGDCSGHRALQCSAELVHPKPKCERLDTQDKDDDKWDLLDSDPACFVYSTSEDVDFEYTLSCKFKEEVLPINNSLANFTYWLSNDNFSIYEPVYWIVQFKLFNFRRLSDTDGIAVVELSKDQMVGKEPIGYKIPLSQVQEKFWVGNRLYLEMSFTSEEFSRDTRFLGRYFVDTSDRVTHSQTSPSSKSNGVVIAVSISAVVVVCLVVSIFVYRCKKAHETQEYIHLQESEEEE